MNTINEEDKKAILTEIANSHSYDSWYGMANDVHENILLDYTIEAMNKVESLRDAEVEMLKEENEELSSLNKKLQLDNAKMIGSTGVIYVQRMEKELATLKKQVIALEHEREEATDIIITLKKEIEALKSVMIAAAEEIKEHWQAHCDEKGYGPTNLLHRLEKGIPSQYGYTAGAFLNQEQTIKVQLEIINNLKKENEDLKSRYEAMSKYATGITNESHKTDAELDTLKKQVEEMRTEREFELAYCFGLMASDGITIDRMAEATTSERWAKIKDEIKKLKYPLT